MFKLTLVTAERKLVLDQEIEQVTVPAFKGTLNILPGHAPLITTLEPGLMSWKLKGADKASQVIVGWGYCEVHPQGVDILADAIDLIEEIKPEEKNKIIIDAQKKLASESLDDENFELQRRELARAQLALEMLNQKQ